MKRDMYKNEVRCFAIMIPCDMLTSHELLKEHVKLLKWIQKMPGFVGVKPELPIGDVIVFRKKKDAFDAVDRIQKKGIKIIKQPTEIFINKEYVG